MTTLDLIPAESDPVHLLTVGDSKSGKSTYAAEAAIAGFNVIYIDADNGISALRYALRNHPEAMKRVHYFQVTRPVNFLKAFLKSSKAAPMKWHKRLNMVWGKLIQGAEPDDTVYTINAQSIPKGWVIVVDSWTACAADSLGIGDVTQSAKLLEGTDQSIYGDANSQLTYITNLIQKDPRHWIVQAHGTRLELYAKPDGVQAKDAKQGLMTLIETIEVPVSCSKPHGQTFPSRFNHIGWMSVNSLGQSEIDFARKPKRVGGGPPNKKDTTDKLSFLKLTGGLGEQKLNDNEPWLIESTHEELVAAKPAVTLASK